MDPTPQPTNPRLRPRILVVDDEEHIRFALSLTLRKAGFDVTVADDGVNAIAVLRQAQQGATTFALAIIDLHLPMMQGTHLLRTMQSENLTLPVIGITGCLETDEITRMQAQGCGAVIHKPFDAETILHQIDVVLSRPTGAALQGSRA